MYGPGVQMDSSLRANVVYRTCRKLNLLADVVHARKKLRLQLDLAMNFSTRDSPVDT